LVTGTLRLTGEACTVFLKDLVVRDLRFGERKIPASTDVARARRRTGRDSEMCMIE